MRRCSWASVERHWPLYMGAVLKAARQLRVGCPVCWSPLESRRDRRTQGLDIFGGETRSDPTGSRSANSSRSQTCLGRELTSRQVITRGTGDFCVSREHVLGRAQPFSAASDGRRSRIRRKRELQGSLLSSGGGFVRRPSIGIGRLRDHGKYVSGGHGAGRHGMVGFGPRVSVIGVQDLIIIVDGETS